jgi:hypothetical protein
MVRVFLEQALNELQAERRRRGDQLRIVVARERAASLRDRVADLARDQPVERAPAEREQRRNDEQCEPLWHRASLSRLDAPAPSPRG